MINILIIVVAGVSMLYGMERSYLELLPKDVGEHLLKYISSNTALENELRSAKIVPYKGKGKESLWITQSEKLEILACNKKQSLLRTLSTMVCAKKQEKKRVNFFSYSPNKKIIIMLVNNEALEAYWVDREGKRFLNFSLEKYLNENIQMQVRDERARGYESVLCSRQRKYYNPVRLAAISNQKRVVFANDHEIFLVHQDNRSYKKIYEDSLKYIGPFNIQNSALFLSLPKGNFINIIFNKEGDKVGVAFDIMRDLLANEKEVSSREVIRNRYEGKEAFMKNLVTKNGILCSLKEFRELLERTSVNDFLSSCNGKYSTIKFFPIKNTIDSEGLSWEAWYEKIKEG